MQNVEYVSRELFQERTDNFMNFLKNDKENISMLTSLVNEHGKLLERLVILEEKSSVERDEIRARMDSERDEFRTRIDEMSKILSEVAAITKDHAGRIEFHAGELREIRSKASRRIEAILMEVAKYAIIALIAGSVGYLMHG